MNEPTRRNLLKGVGAAAGLAAVAKAISPLASWGSGITLEEILQRHYKQLDKDELEALIARLEAKTKEEYGATVSIEDRRPQPDVTFAFGVNLSICCGCRKCAEACHVENNHDRPSENTYITVLELEAGSMDLASGHADYDHEVPQDGKFYMPVQCHHCMDAPCVKACPVEATWNEADGIVVVDYEWCIGCRYCVAACPYHARRFNWKKPEIPADEINPDQACLSNRIRPVGVVEKCTFCLQRTRRGLQPSCAEACPTGARLFGNLLDPDSDIRTMLANKRVFILKEDLGTEPLFYYYFDE